MAGAEDPVLLEVMARVPVDFFHCGHCERLFDVAGIGEAVHSEIRASYPPEMLEQAERLAELLWTLSERYGESLQIRIVDVHSLEGFFKSLRYGVRRYPAFIVDGEAAQTGWEQSTLDRTLQALVAARAVRNGVGDGSP